VSVGGDRHRGEAAAARLAPRVVRQRTTERERGTTERGSVGARPSGDTRQPSAFQAAGTAVDHLACGASKIDDPAFRDYVTTRGRSLLRTAYLLTGNLADAEDLVQSALAKTYQAWDRIEDRAALDSYVRRAMVNTHISWWRRRRLDEFPTDDIPDQAVADHSGSSDLHETLRRAIDRLPQRMRAAVMLRFYDDMTEAEVAEVLGVSLGTVKSTVSRAVAKLRIDEELQPD
jgi:RNA polymerase sigma-70 factor (sigma-E family)